MVQVDVPVIVRQRKTFPKELSRGWPPYSSGFNTKRDKVNATRHARTRKSIEWEGEQALLELTLVDAPHCDRLRTDQAGQRQGAMVDPSRRHQQLSGDVR